jgi:hypothetical protein
MPVRPDSTRSGAALAFGARMRCERERRKISIASIADSTKILGALLEGLEHGDLARWPTGLYRRAFMRAYARAIGLDPEETLKEFLEAFPEPETVPTSTSAPRHAAQRLDVAAAAAAAPAPDLRMSLATIRVGAPRPGIWFLKGGLVQGVGSRCLAAAVDWFVLAVIALATYAVLGSFWAPLCAGAALYYAGGILLLGNTPGVCLFAQARITRSSRRPPEGRDSRRKPSEWWVPVRERFFSALSRSGPRPQTPGARHPAPDASQLGAGA